MSKSKKPKHQKVKITELKSKAKPKKWLLFIPVFFAFILYGNTLNNGYVLDDGIAILQNTHVQAGLQGIPKIFTTNFLNGVNGFNDGLYRPSVLMTFAIEHQVAGNNPAFSHFINVLLYSLCGVFLFLLMRAFFKEQSPFIPLVLTLLFLAHPVHTEAVANLKGRDEILAFLNFTISGFFLYRYIDQGKTTLFIGSLFFFLLAMLSKESAVTLILVFPLMLYFSRAISMRRILSVFGFFALVAIVELAWRTHVLNSMPNPMDPGIISVLNNSVLAAPNLTGRLATGIFIQGLYLLKIVFPHPLLHDYSFNQIPATSFSNPLVIGILILSAAFLVFFIRGLKQKKPYSFGIAFYFITLFATSNLLVYIGATFAERFLFTPVLGLFLSLTVFVPRWMSKQSVKLSFRNQFKVYPLATLVILILMTGYSFKTIQRNADWKDNFSLFEADISHLHNSARAHYNYGTALYEKATNTQMPKERKALANQAIMQLKSAIQIFPDYEDALNNLGNSYKMANKNDSAIITFKTLIQRFPDYNMAYMNLGLAYLKNKKYQQALDPLLKYIEKYPENGQATYLVGSCYGHLKQFGEAEHYLKAANRINPENIEAMKDLGMVYGLEKKYEESLDILLKAYQLNMQDARLLRNIAVTYRFLGNNEKAEAFMQKANALSPTL